MTGFGQTGTGSASKELLHVEQTYISSDLCSEMWGRESASNLEMCTYSNHSKYDGACFGDSG